jgi:CO dehydrogenase maturation factor
MADDYPYVVLDNEAGLENLSRRIVRGLDLMMMVADPSRQGLETVKRLFGLARELGVHVKQLALVVNRSRREGLPPDALALQAETGASMILALPDDEEVMRLSEGGGRLQALPASNCVVTGIDRLLLQAEVPTLPRNASAAFLRR